MRSFGHGWALIAGVVMVAAGCGGGNGSAPAATSTPTATVVSTPTPTRPPTATPHGPIPTPTPTSTPHAAGVTGLLVVDDSVTAGAGDKLGAPPAAWMAAPESALFGRALSNADWSVEGAPDARGVTGTDGQFAISGLAAGDYTLDVSKTLNGNLAVVNVPFTVGTDGSSDIVAEVAWGLVRTTSTYTEAGVAVRAIRAPNGTLLITRDGRVDALGDASRTLADPDGDGRFAGAPCVDQIWSCSQDATCGDGRFCQCVSSCAQCDSCSQPGVCLPKGAPPPYACGANGTCSQSGDRCVCVPSCAACDDCARSVCVPDCQPLTLTAITVGGTSQLVAGRQGHVAATAQLSDGSQIDVTYLVSWTSSDPSVATVDAWGTVSALAVGTTALTATLGTVAGETLASTPWPVEVVAQPTLQAIVVQNSSCYCGPALLSGPQAKTGVLPCVLTPTARSDILPVPNCGQVVQIGATLQLSAIGQFSDGSFADITPDVQWQVDPATVGDVVAGLFTARQAGSAALTASLQSVVSAPVEITVVTQPTVIALSIYADNAVVAVKNDTAVPGGVAIPCGVAGPQADLCCCPGPLASGGPPCGCGYSITVLRGDQLQFHATAQYDTGEWRDVTAAVTWRSSDAATASIDANGLTTAVQAGDATIDAVLGAVTSNPVGLHVVDEATLQSLYIVQQGTDRVVAKGEQVFFTATASYDVGFARDVTTAATWHSSDTSIGGFDSPGVFTGRTPGQVQVWAELDGQQSNQLSLEVFATSTLTYCDPANINRAVWSDDYNRVTLESDCGTYNEPGVAAFRYTVTETQPHGGVFDPCLDLFAYQGKTLVRTIRKEGCGDPFLAADAPARDAAALKYQLMAFWDLKDDAGNPVPPGTYTIYGRFYLYYDPIVSLDVTVLEPGQPVPTRTPTPSVGPLCTPPPCGADEVFFCPEKCPGGCGTVCATRTPTAASPTPAPNPQVITYQLMDGSQIGYVNVTSGAPPALPEPLAGMFQVTRDAAAPPNSIFSFTITAVQFHSASFTVDGTIGSISATTVSPGVAMKTIVSVNGQQVELFGQAPLDTAATDLPVFRDLEIAGGGYALTLFAAPAP